ncbi:hypothetical protein LCGC14_1336380 [marine sediment metagenome]|uniref:Antitoxin n=1 Tax=marine sediment metagenome TaxID=412755 RepID=A0A0F9KFU1_9ZZZZ|nr:MAG: hypothetical protein HeimC3_40230 [Candidatus Heimdallarchaeota archaeon LC_3]
MMGYKTISISDDAYNSLKRRKKKGESFNELILRLVSEPNQKEIESLAGSWKGSIEESKKILNLIYENRENSKYRRVNF